MARLQLEIVTPDRVVLGTEADYVSMPGAEGEFGILPGHIPFFAALKMGCMYFHQDGKTEYVCLAGGFAKITDNTVQILADSAERAGEIDVHRAECALSRAQERLEKAKAPEACINTLRAETALQRAILRLQVSRFPVGIKSKN